MADFFDMTEDNAGIEYSRKSRCTLYMYVYYNCLGENGEMLGFFPFLTNNSLNRQWSFRVEVLTHGVVSWPQRSVIAPSSIFLCLMSLLMGKKKNVSF